MSSLSRLLLDGNQITHIPVQGITGHARAVRTLVLDRNRIRSLAAEQFANTPFLTVLSLMHNDISSMDPAAFSPLSRLRTLDLSGNPFDTLHAQTLRPLTRLRHLDLSNTGLTAMDADTLQATTLLNTLLLTNARLSSLPETAFSHLTNLTHLDLSSNTIQHVSSRLLAGASTLTFLSLKSNAITNVHQDTFAALTALRELYLHRNQITQLPRALFAALSQLRVLELSHNRISTIPSSVFNATTQLQALSMRGNHLTTFDAALSKLVSLRIGNNPLRRLPHLHALPRLQALRINNHHITTIDIATLLPALKHLHVLEIAASEAIADHARLIFSASPSAPSPGDMRVNASLLDTLDVRGIAVQEEVLHSLFAQQQLTLASLHVGWPGMDETTAPLASTVCRALDRVVQEITLTNTAYTQIDLCPGHDLVAVAIPRNPHLRKLTVHTAVRQLNLTGCPHLSELVLPRADVLDMSGTSLPSTPALCSEWGSSILFARNLLNPRFFSEESEQREVLRQCLETADVLDLSDNPFLNNPSAIAAEASRLTVLDDRPLVAEDFTQLAFRSTTPLLTMQHTPVTCGLDLRTIRARVASDPHELLSSQLAYLFICSCAGGYELEGGRCRAVKPPIAAVVAGSVGALLVLQVLALLVYRWCRRHRRLREEHELHVQLLSEREAEVMALKAGWAIEYEELRLQACVASGAYGDVWRAKWDGVEVAVKVLKQAVMAFDEATIAEFEKEVDFLQRTRHPHVVRFFGAGTDPNGSPFLVLEYVSVGSLRTLLQQDLASVIASCGEDCVPSDGGRSTSDELGESGERGERGGAHQAGSVADDCGERCALSVYQLKCRLAGDVASGMAFIHSLGQLHRDLKSGNVLVSDRLRAKITDFGTIRTHFSGGREAKPQARDDTRRDGENEGDEASLSLTTGVGTPLYMAPEALAGGQYDQRADVFSFGVLMWELATQQVPDLIRQEKGEGYRGPTLSTLLQLLNDGARLRFPTDREMHVPDSFVDIAQACMAQSPAERPSFQELQTRCKRLS